MAGGNSWSYCVIVVIYDTRKILELPLHNIPTPTSQRTKNHAY